MAQTVERRGECALQRNLASARSGRTSHVYERAWRRFCLFARERGEGFLPARPETVAVYLSEMGETRKPATVRTHLAAISAFHTDAGFPSPGRHPGIRRVVSGHARRKGVAQEQASALDQGACDAILATVAKRRRSRGGFPETDAEYRERVAVDRVIVNLMRDAMLRRSEAAGLRWCDVDIAPDGSGVVSILRSKTDQEGRGAHTWVSRGTVDAMRALETVRAPDRQDRVIGLSAAHIARRIARMAREAGLEGSFSGHSPRIGMAHDLVRSGMELSQIMQAGRWKGASMPMRYTERLAVGRGAVAQYHQGRDA